MTDDTGAVVLYGPDGRRAALDEGHVHVRFTRSVTTHRLHWPPQKGDFIGRKYFTGKRWVPRNRKHLRRHRWNW